MNQKNKFLTALVVNFLCFLNSAAVLIGAGKFDFNDGTTQGWTLDQMYVTSSQVKFSPVIGYTLSNSNNELVASTGSLLIGRSDQNDIYLESPDLSSRAEWQGIGGISVDVKRLLYSPGWGDFPNIFYVQLQLRVIDTADNNKEKLFGEYDGSNYIFHDIQTYGKLYQITWQPSWLTGTRYKVKQIRVRITGPGDVAQELWYRGSWNIDNVLAIGGSATNNTNIGTNVQVNLGGGVNVTFDTVTGVGNTALTTSGSGTPPPGGFSILPMGSPTYYSITTTATYSGNIKIGIQYNDAGLTAQQEAALKLQVYEQPPGQWKNITVSVDVNANIIYGVVTHLSEFAIMFLTGTAEPWVLTNQPTGGTVNCFTVAGAELFAGTEAGGVFISSNNGDTWNPVNTGLTNLRVRALCTNGADIFAGTWGSGVFRTSNKGASWTPVNTGLSDVNVTTLYTGESKLIAGTWGGGVFLSTNNGSSWTPINTGLTETHIRALFIKWANFFAGTINGLFLSMNNGTSWETMNVGLTNTAAISLASMADNSSEQLFTGTDGGGVFMITTNTNWTAINNGLTNLHVPYLCFGGSNLFAATWGGGVFLTQNQGTNWSAYNEGFTNLYIRTLIVSGTNIFAGTNDGGIWRRSISDLISEVPDIAANPASWDYGSVTVGAHSDRIFVIKNEGTAELNVTGTSLTGANALEFSIQTGGSSFSLVPGAIHEIMVRFSPTGTGSKNAALILSSNDPDENPLQINLTATGVSGVTVPISPTINNPMQMAGTEFIVNIETGTTGNPVTDLFGISFRLNYTSTNYVNFMTAEPGPFIGSDVIFFPTPDDPNGKVAIGISRKAGQGGVNGNGSIAKIKFITELSTPHNTPVDFTISDVTANNSVGNPISLTSGALKITIQAGVLVWPGDTNNSGLVDQADILPLGLHWERIGQARQGASVMWAGQLATPWTPQAATFADANGDGIVNQTDVLPIGLNWNKAHTLVLLAKEIPEIHHPEKASAPQLTLQISGDFNPNQDFFIDILGNNLENVLGISYELIYSPVTFTEPRSVEIGPDNILGTAPIFFPMINKAFGVDSGKISVGISRKYSEGGVTGSGRITRIVAHMAAGAVPNASQTTLTFVNVTANDPAGNPVSLEAVPYTLTTQVSDGIPGLPRDFVLYANYPNPFNPGTTISFSCPQPSEVTLTIYDLQGQTVKQLIHAELPAGPHTSYWNGRDEAGKLVATGIYFYQIEAKQVNSGKRSTAIKKMTLMK